MPLGLFCLRNCMLCTQKLVAVCQGTERTNMGCKGLPQAHDSQPFQHLPKKLWASPDTAPTSYKEQKQGNMWQRKYILSC